mmetsp:Transcript_16782/g.51836  ORF Transcript_16782/g.51836 Transcript_16782/m.51836 type:complete len:205 (-) Transcript_16782:288-902(-)
MEGLQGGEEVFPCLQYNKRGMQLVQKGGPLDDHNSPSEHRLPQAVSLRVDAPRAEREDCIPELFIVGTAMEPGNFAEPGLMLLQLVDHVRTVAHVRVVVIVAAEHSRTESAPCRSPGHTLAVHAKVVRGRTERQVDALHHEGRHKELAQDKSEVAVDFAIESSVLWAAIPWILISSVTFGANPVVPSVQQTDVVSIHCMHVLCV